MVIFVGIVEIRKIGEQRMSKVNRKISKAEKRVDLKVGNLEDRKQRLAVLNELYGERGKLGTFLEVLGEIRKG